MSTIASRIRLAAAVVVVLSAATACGEPTTPPPDPAVTLNIRGSVVESGTQLPIPFATIELFTPGLSFPPLPLPFLQGKVWATAWTRVGGDYVLRARVQSCSATGLYLAVRAEGYASRALPTSYDARRVRCTNDPQTFDVQLMSSPPSPP